VSGFLKPDKTRSVSVAGVTLTIHEKIIPDGMRAAKDVASWCKRGQPMKPCGKLNDGSGRPRGICVHNTPDLKVATGTNAAEQYSRATYNGNMAGVIVHYYIWRDEIWQLLRLNERGWHATDGKSRRGAHRAGQQIGGNLDTIAIEAIGKDQKTEDTTALLCAWLCQEYGLDPAKDIYQHNYFYPAKNCPAYIRPHWAQFLAQVSGYAAVREKEKPADEATEQLADAIEHTVKAGDTLWALAVHYLGSGHKWPIIQEANDGIDPTKLRIGMKLAIPKSEGRK
jgi:N-acetylmuramoyl-L-alanine amidase CwlA